MVCFCWSRICDAKFWWSSVFVCQALFSLFALWIYNPFVFRNYEADLVTLQVRWALFPVHHPLLCIPWVPGSGQILSGIHLSRCSQAAHAGGHRGVVDRGHISIADRLYSARGKLLLGDSVLIVSCECAFQCVSTSIMFLLNNEYFRLVYWLVDKASINAYTYVRTGKPLIVVPL